jgi:hypothetical protein
MLEACYCGRSGELENRTVVLDGEGKEALECPRCGHLDHMGWLPEENREKVLEKARRRDQESRRASVAA